MKKKLGLLIIGLILMSCSSNKKEIIILKALDQFETYEKNEQLGKDIVDYMFPIYLEKEFSDIKELSGDNVYWYYFIRESDKQVSFRLNLSDEALNHRKELTKFFKNIANNQVIKHVSNKNLFENAVAKAKESLLLLDNKEFDQFWNYGGNILNSISTKDSFISTLPNREKIKEVGGERIYRSKQYYKNIPDMEGTDFYVVNFEFENDINMMEQIIFQLENSELKISGYNYVGPQ